MMWQFLVCLSVVGVLEGVVIWDLQTLDIPQAPDTLASPRTFIIPHPDLAGYGPWEINMIRHFLIRLILFGILEGTLVN